MSHRCIACDWSPYSQSPYNEHIQYDSYRPYKLVNDAKTGETYCNACYESIEVTVNFDLLDDEDGGA